MVVPNAPGTDCAVVEPCRWPRDPPLTHPEPTRITDIAWQAAKSTPGTCIPKSRACLSRQSSPERKGSATDKGSMPLRTAPHFLNTGNGALFSGKKRYVRHGALPCLGGFRTGRRTKALDRSPKQDARWNMERIGRFSHARMDSQRSWQDIAQMYSQRGLGRQKGLFRARNSRDVFPNTVFHCFSRLKTYISRLSCQKQAV